MLAALTLTGRPLGPGDPGMPGSPSSPLAPIGPAKPSCPGRPGLPASPVAPLWPFSPRFRQRKIKLSQPHCVSAVGKTDAARAADFLKRPVHFYMYMFYMCL